MSDIKQVSDGSMQRSGAK